MRGITTLILISMAMSAALASEAKKGEKAQQPTLAFDYQTGPLTAKLGEVAEIALPKGYYFVDRTEVPAFMKATENLPAGDELGIVLGPDMVWFVIYRFDEIGFVKDDEKDTLDADQILSEIKEGTERSNEIRKQRGWHTVSVVGWAEPPHYNSVTHNLEWSVEATAEDGRTINHSTRILGRRGVMKAQLVSGKADYLSTLAAYRDFSKNFQYSVGQEYSAWVKGDKVAEYGLTALILGGGAAAAAKTGLLKSLVKLLVAGWKLVALAIVGFWGILKRLFSGRPKSPAPQDAQSFGSDV